MTPLLKYSALALVAVVSTGCLLLAGAAEVHATADGPDYFAVTGVAANDVLNVRAEPSANSAKIGQIPHDGRAVQNLGCQGGPTFAEWQQMTAAQRKEAGRKRWCRVRYGDVEGGGCRKVSQGGQRLCGVAGGELREEPREWPQGQPRE